MLLFHQVAFRFELDFKNSKAALRLPVSFYHTRLIRMEDCTRLMAALSLKGPAAMLGSWDPLQALPAELKVMILRHLDEKSALALFAVSQTYHHTFTRYRDEIELRMMINTLRARDVDMSALRCFSQTWLSISLMASVPQTASEKFLKDMKAAVKEYHDQLLLNTPMKLDSKHCSMLSMITRAVSLPDGPPRSRFCRGSSTKLVLNMDDRPTD